VASPLEGRRVALGAEQQKAAALRDVLIDTCDDPKLLARRAEAQRDVAEAKRAVEAPNAALSRHLQRAPEDRMRAAQREDPAAFGRVGFDLAEARKEYNAERARLEAEIEKASVGVRKAEAALAAIENEMLHWTI
jgi:hypothetical protein